MKNVINTSSIWGKVNQEIQDRVMMSPIISDTNTVNREMNAVINERRGALIMAWCAETGVMPSDAMIVTGMKGNNFCCWIEKKNGTVSGSFMP